MTKGRLEFVFPVRKMISGPALKGLEEEFSKFWNEKSSARQFGNNLRLLLALRHFTHVSLAPRVGVTSSHLVKITGAKTKPSFIVLNTLAQVLKVNLRTLLHADLEGEFSRLVEIR